ncbi:hypothetical protein EJ04DRAFT_79240 [Polyplosphaeria fusca]|uniref:Uncharacterized protein n=1 Tax=Polyplosphaeria fusca TaxID=682080 RepID=A0A9P4V5Y2_9PLEO|nr:hypothetical protein EJ04DRAFT_79240 [Polyplosphaeria fusca]
MICQASPAMLRAACEIPQLYRIEPSRTMCIRFSAPATPRRTTLAILIGVTVGPGHITEPGWSTLSRYSVPRGPLQKRKSGLMYAIRASEFAPDRGSATARLWCGLRSSLQSDSHRRRQRGAR